MDKLEENDKKQLRADIGRRLYESRIAAGLTQGDTARIGNTHQQSISDAEHGRIFLPVDVIYRLCQAYGISCDYLISGVRTSADYASFDARLHKLNNKQFQHYKAMTQHFLDALDIPVVDK